MELLVFLLESRPQRAYAARLEGEWEGEEEGNVLMERKRIEARFPGRGNVDEAAWYNFFL